MGDFESTARMVGLQFFKFSGPNSLLGVSFLRKEETGQPIMRAVASKFQGGGCHL
jgi:hypothetical protein